MYANLLATAMDANRVREAHPAFVEIIRQLTPDEARIVGLFKETEYFPVISLQAQPHKEKPNAWRLLIKRFSTVCDKAKCEFPELGPTYIDNLCRLGLMIEDDWKQVDPPGDYELLENHPIIQPLKDLLATEGLKYEMRRGLLRVTSLGSQFQNACIS
jgi:Abortive infection alpha